MSLRLRLLIGLITVTTCIYGVNYPNYTYEDSEYEGNINISYREGHSIRNTNWSIRSISSNCKEYDIIYYNGEECILLSNATLWIYRYTISNTIFINSSILNSSNIDMYIKQYGDLYAVPLWMYENNYNFIEANTVDYGMVEYVKDVIIFKMPIDDGIGIMIFMCIIYSVIKYVVERFRFRYKR